ALGAAYLAGLSGGYWNSVEEISSQWKVSGKFIPNMNEEVKKSKLHLWQRAIHAVLAWSKS
ncbi:MAG: glycerol kinase, partial [Bacteroidota bacterium]